MLNFENPVDVETKLVGYLFGVVNNDFARSPMFEFFLRRELQNEEIWRSISA